MHILKRSTRVPDLSCVPEETTFETQITVHYIIKYSNGGCEVNYTDHPIKVNSFITVIRLKEILEPNVHYHYSVHYNNQQNDNYALGRPHSPTSPSSTHSDYRSEIDSGHNQCLLLELHLIAIDRHGKERLLEDNWKQLYEFNLPNDCKITCLIEISE
jgi:hypothetical protein